jgi:4-hydroxy-tetrahydrodipicolinate synthase
VIAGAGSNDTRHSVQLTEEASALGVDAILAVAPYYNRPSQAGFAAHFSAVAAATDLPVLIYDIPVRTGRKVSSETLIALGAEVPNLAGVKDAAGNPGESARVIAETPDTFEYYSGDDSLTLPLLAVGAVGVIGVATHWSGLQHGEMIRAFRKGDTVAARDTNARLVPSYRFETSEVAPNPIPAKAMMRVLGLAVGHCRLPMGPEPDGIEVEARRVLEALGQT